MVKRKGSYETQINEKMRGGEGRVKIEQLLTPDELNNKGRLFAKITIEPGSSVGSHVHEGEMESFFIIKGEAEISDNGELVTVSEGDSILTRSGEGHSVRNVGACTLEMMALILHK